MHVESVEGDFLASQTDASDELHNAVCLSVESSSEKLVIPVV